MRVEFLTELRAVYNGKGTWRLYDPFVAKIDGEPYVIQAGFKTDLDSVPRLPLAYWIAKGRATTSAVLHDYLYSIQKPRDWCDDVLYEAMKVEGVNSFYRGLIYAGVRAFGGSAYRKRAE